jgi:hypothetical protein
MLEWHFATRAVRRVDPKVRGEQKKLENVMLLDFEAHTRRFGITYLGCLTTYRGSYLAAIANATESRLTSDSSLLWLLPMFHCASVAL